MAIIPKLQKAEISDKTVDLSKLNWVIDDETDSRVSAEAYSIQKSCSGGIPVHIKSGKTDCESYHMEITEDKVDISSDGANGSFYALQTLKQLIFENDGIVNCQTIDDAPDMKYRGFYHDVTRGKVPTLETLKELVDTMASYKMNSLQLYIEHTFEFKEYEFCRDKFGYLSKEEIKELDKYCKSKFIDLIPSISTFGHLYELLSNDKYKHLCELPDHTPKYHYFWERMLHHTINPELDESFELIKSLIDQYLEVSSSDKFNICCDETFDLGTGINKGKDKGKLYVNFVKKLVNYLTSKGKTVMMWGDILLQHPECITELPENVIFLNWGYDKNPPEEQYRKMYETGRKQIMCPGTSSWASTAEDIAVEDGNITALAGYAYKFGAEGLLNTNWGDFGNMASITTSSYGLILGAAISWNKETKADSEFKNEVSEKVYGNKETVGLIYEISELKNILTWFTVVVRDKRDPIDKNIYTEEIKKLHDIRQKLDKLTYKSELIKREVLVAVDGYLLIAQACAKFDGHTISCGVDVDKWCDEFSDLWLARNKKSELDEILKIMKERT